MTVGAEPFLPSDTVISLSDWPVCDALDEYIGLFVEAGWTAG